MFRVAFVLAVVAVVVSCYSPAYKDCAISCADNQCPSGLSCVAGMCRTGEGTQACGLVGSDGGLSDGDAPGDAPDDAGYPTGDFGSATLVDLGSATGNVDPSLTPNMREMFFKRGPIIYVTTRSTLGQPWTTPMPVGFTAGSGATDQTPSIQPNDTTMLFSSNRTGTMGGYDIWMTTRPSMAGNWSTPALVVPLNSTSDDSGPNISGDQTVLVFASTRNSATMSDLFISTRGSAGDAWGAPSVIGELSTTFNEVHPDISPDGLTIYYQTTADGPANIYTAHRATKTSMFDPPHPLSMTINDPSATDGDPWVSPDGHHIFFSSNRGGPYQIYEAIR